MAVAVIQHYFGSKPVGIVRQGGGLNNFVFAVDHREGAFIVRMSPQAAKINDYLKEQWAITRARAVGVPTPEVLEVGCEAVTMPYMIARKVEGCEATHHPQCHPSSPMHADLARDGRAHGVDPYRADKRIRADLRLVRQSTLAQRELDRLPHL
jgi:aminoglycoside phosphotransferase (APT) family kinase protein